MKHGDNMNNAAMRLSAWRAAEGVRKLATAAEQNDAHLRATKKLKRLALALNAQNIEWLYAECPARHARELKSSTTILLRPLTCRIGESFTEHRIYQAGRSHAAACSPRSPYMPKCTTGAYWPSNSYFSALPAVGTSA